MFRLGIRESCCVLAFVFLQRSAWVLHWHMGVAVACDDVLYAAILKAYSFIMVLTAFVVDNVRPTRPNGPMK